MTVQNSAENSQNLREALKDVQTSWGLSHPQMAALCQIDVATYINWVQDPFSDAPGGPLIPIGMEHAMPLVAIFQRLRKSIPSVEEQVKWMTTGHPDFGDNKPIDVAASSPENLSWLAYYLESALNKSK